MSEEFDFGSLKKEPKSPKQTIVEKQKKIRDESTEILEITKDTIKVKVHLETKDIIDYYEYKDLCIICGKERLCSGGTAAHAR